MPTHQPHHPDCDPPQSNRLDLAFRLVAGDLPPTNTIAFDDPSAHQPDQIDKRVILQSATWVDDRAHWHRLEDMSAEYRSNVLAFLDRECPAWVRQTASWTYAEAITGAISGREAANRLELLDLLTPGWTGHTVLGRRLHQLNGTQPPPLAPPPFLLGAHETTTPQTLRDQDTGSWRVLTASTTTYLIDLDRRRIARHPGNHDQRHASNGHLPRPVNQLPDDDAWTTLTALIQCRTGRPLIALDERRDGPGYRISTSITHIERVAHGPGIDPAEDPR